MGPMYIKTTYTFNTDYKMPLPSRLGLYNTPTAPLQRGKTPTPDKCPDYDTEQSDGAVPVMLNFWGMRSTPLLPSLPGPLWLGEVTHVRVLSMR